MEQIVVIHATNAQLPDSFTEDEIQSVVDLAQSGTTNPGTSAWGTTATDGNLSGGLNVNQPNVTGTGRVNIRLLTRCPMLIMRSPLPCEQWQLVSWLLVKLLVSPLEQKI